MREKIRLLFRVVFLGGRGVFRLILAVVMWGMGLGTLYVTEIAGDAYEKWAVDEIKDQLAPGDFTYRHDHFQGPDASVAVASFLGLVIGIGLLFYGCKVFVSIFSTVKDS